MHSHSRSLASPAQERKSPHIAITLSSINDQPYSTLETTVLDVTPSLFAMAVPFGFSAGDIAMAVKFTVQVANAMRDTGGAVSDYQQSFEYWKNLLVVYQQLHGLHAQCTDPELLQEIRALAAAAEKPVHSYIKGLHADFGATLNDCQITSKTLRSFKKAKWALHASKKEEKFRQQMSAQLQTIQMKFEQLNMLVSRVSTSYGGS